MSLTGLLDLLAQSPGYRRATDALAQPGVLDATAPDAAKAPMIAALRRDLGRPLPSMERAGLELRAAWIPAYAGRAIGYAKVPIEREARLQRLLQCF